MSIKKTPFPTNAAAEAFTLPPQKPLAYTAAEAFTLPPHPPLADEVAKLTNPFPPGEAAKAFAPYLCPFPTKAAQLMTPPTKWECYVGMTMDLARRQREHKSRYGKIRKWTLHSRHSSKAEAQAAEKELAKELNCHAHGGGRGNELALWYVYSFEYEK